jgi:hypothetical protein
VYKPTGEMRADITTKPLQGDLLRRMRAELMGMEGPGEDVSNTVKHRGV